jgi:hypothetical protein
MTELETSLEHIVKAKRDFGTLEAARAYVRLCNTYGLEA